MRRELTLRNLTLIAVEEGLVLAALLAAMSLRFGSDVGAYLSDEHQWARILLVVFTSQISLYYHDLYDLKALNSRRELLIRLCQALGVASIVLAGVYYVFPGVVLGRGVFALFVGVLIVSVVVWRLAYTSLMTSRPLAVRILLVGSGELARKIAAEVRTRASMGFQLVGCLATDADTVAVAADGLPPVLGGYDRLSELGASEDVDRVVVAISERRGKFPVRELLELRVGGKRVEDGCTFYEGLTGKLLVEFMRPSQLIFGEGFEKSSFTAALKRTVDVVASFLGLLLSVPIWLVFPLLIKVDSPGEVFYRQQRTGERGKPFDVLKFRSMRANAEANSGAVWATTGDARVTRVGKFMRKTRIDEIPQLWNVLRGDMSFVGPRPERPVFVAQLAEEIPFYLERHSVKPGVTGLAQVKYPYGSSVEDAVEKLRYDLYYIKNMGFWMDVSIIIETVKVVLFGKGAK